MVRKAGICVIALALASGCLEFPGWEDDSDPIAILAACSRGPGRGCDLGDEFAPTPFATHAHDLSDPIIESLVEKPA